jgi:hypothetical protein
MERASLARPTLSGVPGSRVWLRRTSRKAAFERVAAQNLGLRRFILIAVRRTRKKNEKRCYQKQAREFHSGLDVSSFLADSVRLFKLLVAS